MAVVGSGVEADVSKMTSPPVRPAGTCLVTTMALAQLGLFLALAAPVFVGLAIKVQDVAPGHEVAALGLVATVGAVAAFVANPVFGRISDRTTGRFGRRRPWLVAGALGLALCLLVIATTQSLAVLVVAWFFGQASANAALAAHVATVADQVPTFQRGKVAGLLGVVQNCAILGAAYAGKYFSGDLLVLFLVPGLVAVGLMLLFAVVLPDRPLLQRPPSGGGLRTLLQTFWVNPRKYPDFALVWASRFLLVTASYLFTTFRLLYLQHQFSLSLGRATAVMATGVLVYTITLVIAAQSTGLLSDRLQRRKVFVFTATLIFGLGLILLSQADTVGMFYVAEIVLGLGYGIYMGVDLALVIDVLPDPDNAAKDLGVFNIANAAPQSIAPALGAVLVGLGGSHSYGLLLGTAAVVSVAGALVIVPVKKVR
ncbi:MFS family permease [Streptomyces sp. LBL]|uniref:MFS transporter n=1 Tax=Streptomyces sp. LBL TaxID=2940562 RepID=UPI00247436DD|nr:MFS transporter [Streptomyces sp. LBL]MDH6624102.1 MFS family permease [Streptomyces sp. LBL]